MKSTCVPVVWLLVFLPAAGIAQEPSAVRAMDDASVEAFACGQRDSAAFRELVDDIDASGVIVHVATGDTVIFATAGSTRLVGAAGGQRYLRVTLRPGLPLEQRAAVLAHELQHVREIAHAAVTSQEAVRAVFGQIGRPVPGAYNAFETDAAADAGRRVWRELRTSRRSARLTSQQR